MAGINRGCIIGVAVTGALVLWTVFAIREPGRNAGKAWESIKPGMSIEEVESGLKGRYYCFFQQKTADGWSRVSREDFVGTTGVNTNGASVERRLQLIFLGTAPNKMTIYVDMDASGRVSNVAEPFSWD